MIPRVHIAALEASTPFEDAARIAAQSPFSRLPIYRRSLDRMLGFIHIQDVVRHTISDNPVQLDTLIRPLLVVPAGSTADRVLQRLREGRQHIAIVMDEYGGTKGLVTIGDVLDEIFGGIANEFTLDYPEPEPVPDGRLRLSGSTRLDEATLLLGVHFTGQSHTLAGLISETLGRIPQANEKVVIADLEFEVEAVDSHVVQTVLVRPVEIGSHD
jgi:CBS domain containing-hemolysin-like protein